jgi:hypothetical protein
LHSRALAVLALTVPVLIAFTVGRYDDPDSGQAP